MYSNIETTISPDLVYEYNVTPRYRTKKINLVLLGGKAGVGKTTIAEYLVDKMTELYPTLLIDHTAFAKPIKEIAYSIFKWDGNKDEKGRKLLQVIGTDAGREYNENIWVEYFENNVVSGLFPANFIFVDDWRFPNEVEYFKKNFLFEITTIRVESDLPKTPPELANHPSENSLPSASWQWLNYNSDEFYNFSIFNCSTIEDLYNKLGGVINHLSTKVITY